MTSNIILIENISDFDVIPKNIIENKNIKKFSFNLDIHEFLKSKKIEHEMADDILDEINSFKEIGKTPGKDKKQGKRTLLSVIGKVKAMDFCEKLAEEFVKNNKKYISKNPILKDLLYYNIDKLK